MSHEQDPYEVLGITHHDDEQTIRQRYLALVREHPPEREPDLFARIHEAYEALRNPERRLKRLLLEPPDDEQARQRLNQSVRDGILHQRLGLDALRRLAQAEPGQ